MNFKSRLKRIEKRLGVSRDDEIKELVLNNGQVIKLTNKELDEIFAEIWKNNTKRLTGSAKHEKAIAKN
jgi:hypothetical protein